MWETWVWSLGWEDSLERERLPTPVFWPREFHGLVHAVAKNWTQLSDFTSVPWLWWWYHVICIYPNSSNGTHEICAVLSKSVTPHQNNESILLLIFFNHTKYSGADCCITMWMYLMSFNFIPKNSFFFLFHLAMPCSIQDLSSPTRDWTHAPCGGTVES